MIFKDKFKAVLMAEPAADFLAAFVTTACFIIFAKKVFKKI